MTKPKEKLQAHFLRLREGDFDYLNTAYPTLGPSPVIRQLVAKHVDLLREQAEAAVPASPLSLEIEDLSNE